MWKKKKEERLSSVTAGCKGTLTAFGLQGSLPRREGPSRRPAVLVCQALREPIAENDSFSCTVRGVQVLPPLHK